MEELSLPDSAQAAAKVRDGFQALNAEMRTLSLKLLVTSLTDEEADELSLMLENKHRIDIFVNLPVELREYVAGYIDAADIATVLNVSKSWRNLWSSGPVLTTLANRWLPGFIEYYDVKLFSMDEEIYEVFYIAARNLRYRCLGQFSSCTFYRPYRIDQITAIGPDIPQQDSMIIGRDYAAGRVAWQVQSDAFMVRDLSTGSVSTYEIPGHGSVVTDEIARLAALGDKLVVVLEGRFV
jgi:hypothetical protein